MSKKNLILGSILAVLIILAYAYQGPLKKWQSNLGKTKNVLAQIDIAKADKIEFTKSGKTSKFEKLDGAWAVAGQKNVKAKEEIIAGFLDDVKKAGAENLELVSTNKDKKKDFQTDDSGIAVKISAGKNETDFIVGKLGNDFISTYISTADKNDTYSVEYNLRRYLDQAEWTDSSIFASDKNKISKIRFQYPNSSFTVEKIKNSWTGTLPKKFSVGKGKLDKIIGIMSNLESAGSPEQTFKGTGLEKHSIIVQATGEGIDNTIMVGDLNGENLYFAKRGDSDTIYLITKEQKSELEKSMKQLR